MRSLLLFIFFAFSPLWAEEDRSIQKWDLSALGDSSTKPQWHKLDPDETPFHNQGGIWGKKSFTWQNETGAYYLLTCVFCREQINTLVGNGQTQRIHLNGPVSLTGGFFQYSPVILEKGQQYEFESWRETVYTPLPGFLIYTPAEAQQNNAIHIVSTTIYLGMILSLLLVNLVLVISFKQRQYYYFLAFCISYTLSVLPLSIMPFWFYPETIQMVQYADPLLALSLFFIFKFALNYLNLAALHPRFTYWTHICIWLFPIWATVQMTLNLPTHAQFNPGFYLLGILTIWGYSLYLWIRTRSTLQLFLLLALGAYLLGVMTYVLFLFAGSSNLREFQGIPPYAGHLIEIVVFTAFVARRVGILQQDEEKEEEYLLNQRQDFLRNTSHELRTPLVGLLGVSEDRFPLLNQKILAIKELVQKVIGK